MKEYIETIPVNDAFSSEDECPFCYLERMSEQRTIRYVLGPGASYMEPEVRAATDSEGFCAEHYQKLYDFGNALGNALMLQSRYVGLLLELEKAKEEFNLPEKRSLFKGKQMGETSLESWAKRDSCYICRKNKENMDRYYATFFTLIKEQEFRTRVENSKGFCMRHFSELLDSAKTHLPNSQRQWFYDTVTRLVEENLQRVKADIDHFVSMFDYRSAGKDWGNARDAVSRGMQKMQGRYPADPPYKDK